MHDVSLQSPPAIAWRSRYTALRTRLEAFPLSLILLAMRIAIGSVFFNAGLLKLHSFEFAVKLFADEYRLPLIPPNSQRGSP